ncbi:MAG TPA: hypothetical protein VE377_17280 [Candidatus Dormibacteraeota bacterium]|nr:hypothetical protein [Candidatus Dormibacteraeota bacterium]
MAEDLRFELAILATVQGFYQKLLRDTLGGDVPIPRGLDEDALRHSEHELPNTLSQMYRWLHLLDMAITPAMLRQALTPDTDSEVAEALLRYFVRRREATDVNRDKTDVVATFLYRHPRVPGQWEQSGYGLDGALPLSPFEIALIEILADTDVPSLPEEHVQLLRRFDPFLEEVSRFRDFNALIDSGMIGRVRELKQWLDSSFYHPGVLATVSAYNAGFGKKFDDLFAKALNEIKTFGQALEEMGGTILTTVDGVEVTVEHVAAIEEKQLLQADYGSTLEKFRRVSKLKKELDRRPPIRRSLLTPAAQATRAASHAGAAPKAAKAAAPKAPVATPVFQPPAITAQQLFAEESKLRRVEESIRVFVRVADPKYRQVVPMRFFNLTLTTPEADAYSASFLEEKSLRADVARTLIRMVSISARISTELEELKRSQKMSSLWKLHADAVVVLLDMASTATEEAGSVAKSAEQSGSGAAAKTIHESVKKLRNQSDIAVKTLANVS